jgi:hypothetical protein
MAKADRVSVNTDGPGLTTTPVVPGHGPFSDMQAVTGADVKGVSIRGENVEPIETAEAG